MIDLLFYLHFCVVTDAMLFVNCADKESGHYVNLQVMCIAKNHVDIVRCVVYQDTRVYSAGYVHTQFAF